MVASNRALTFEESVTKGKQKESVVHSDRGNAPGFDRNLTPGVIILSHLSRSPTLFTSTIVDRRAPLHIEKVRIGGRDTSYPVSRFPSRCPSLGEKSQYTNQQRTLWYGRHPPISTFFTTDGGTKQPGLAKLIPRAAGTSDVKNEPSIQLREIAAQNTPIPLH